ncbi:SDR family oxidoreductase [Sulfuracidifex tepidarius]|uniref:L-rhamnose 1-dehydrogenase n=1 Tax=Sulfuracidifex tepidarius TaxID=1294262 RepID=A0A510E2C2_9CREN|nr:SDR family oxidoreductase [Sulfuracidifex tepidarius]BBG23891.1 L-rhamnose 1-dehydrogenase [Sulfuracidifex tepidarius]BBG26646.1 L-rhamnose 1-dehydrogenase [Sulfuracidifex tepidarius]
MRIDISGKRVLVTASSSGIGKGVARAFLKEGCKVIISSRNKENLDKTVSELKSSIFPSVWGVQMDLTDYHSIEAGLRQIIDLMGGIDVLIFNFGNPTNEPSYFDETTMEDWEYSVRMYLEGPIQILKRLLPFMRRQRYGRIFFLSSWTVKSPQSHFTLADVSRSPVIQLSKILSKDEGRNGITVNTVLMGSFPTPGAERSLKRIAERKNESYDELWKREVLSPIAVGRIGDPEKDLGSLLVFLSSEYGGYVTGSSILIDGGSSPYVL